MTSEVKLFVHLVIWFLTLCTLFLHSSNYCDWISQSDLNFGTANCTSLSLKIEKPGVLAFQQVSSLITEAEKNGNAVPHAPTEMAFGQKVAASRAYRTGAVPALFFISGALTWGYREEIHDFRNRYVPDFDYEYDNYLQYAPSAMVYGLNLAGVKGTHTAGRATMNYAYSTVIMALLVNTLKYTTHVMRPDGEGYNSFPSGHTATAFSSATFLHKEYGQSRDPRYSVMGFGIAAGTGISRQANDRHWISDVLVGAGIGILSTELGYLVGEKIHNDRGVNSLNAKTNYYNPSDKPSFIELKMGRAHSLGHSLDGGTSSSLSPGVCVGMEGAWFFNEHWGIGSQSSFLSYAFTLSGAEIGLGSLGQYFYDDIEFQSLGTSFFMIGPYFDRSLNSYWSVSGKANIGLSMGAKGEAVATVLDQYQHQLGETQEVMLYHPGNSFGWGAGLAIRRKICRTVHLKGFAEYFRTDPEFYLQKIESVNPDQGTVQLGAEHLYGRLHSNSLVFGLSFTAMLW